MDGSQTDSDPGGVEIKFGYSTNAYTEHTLEVAIEKIGELGYDGVELLADKPHLPATPMDLAEIDHVRELLQENDLEIANVNCNTSVVYRTPETDPEFGPTFLTPQEELRKQRMDHVITTLQNASRLGAASVCISSGEKPEEMSEKRASELVYDALSRILEQANQLGMNVGIEFEPGHYFGESDTVTRWIDRLENPRLGFNFDIGHSWLTDSDTLESFQSNVDRIWNVHVEDLPGCSHRHLIPGEGDMPLETLFRGFLDTDYKEFYTVELYPYSDEPGKAGRKALRYLLDLLQDIRSV